MTAEPRRCSGCDKPDTETALLTRQELCGQCLKVAIDDSKKKGKAAQ